jgi:hypothetical protein
MTTRREFQAAKKAEADNRKLLKKFRAEQVAAPGGGGGDYNPPIPQDEVSGLVSALAARQTIAQKGAVDGYAGLDGTGKVPMAQLPSGLGYSPMIGEFT